MEEKEFNSYLLLMYKAFAEICAISMNLFTLVNKKTCFIYLKYLYRISRIADEFHNLPYKLKSMNIGDFNHNDFWKKISDLEHDISLSILSQKKLYKKIIDREEKKLLDQHKSG